MHASNKKEACVLVVESNWPSWIVSRRELNDAGAAEAGTEDAFMSRYRTKVFSAQPRIGAKTQLGESGESLLARLLGSLDDVLVKLQTVIKKLPRPKGPVVVLAVNAGVLDIVMNLICSAKHNNVRSLTL